MNESSPSSPPPWATPLLGRVTNNHRRFIMNKSFFWSLFEKGKVKRKYLMGCLQAILKAFLKRGFQRPFFDLGRAGYCGPQSKKGVDFACDTRRTFTRADPAALAEADAEAEADAKWVTLHGPKIDHNWRKGEEIAAAAMACGGGHEQREHSEQARA